MNNLKIIPFIVILVLLIVASLLLNNYNYVPANEMDVFTRNYPYEGFQSYKETNNKTEYSSYPNNENLDSYSQWEINNTKNICYKISGSNGLVCSPHNDTIPKDIYSESKGSLDCHSYGLMNSKGFLCLNDKQKTLYTTRGGNASGGGGDIGLPSK
jgi:hypothetical protein